MYYVLSPSAMVHRLDLRISRLSLFALVYGSLDLSYHDGQSASWLLRHSSEVIMSPKCFMVTSPLVSSYHVAKVLHEYFATRLKLPFRSSILVTSPLVFSYHFAQASWLLRLCPLVRLFIVALLHELASGDAQFQVGGVASAVPSQSFDTRECSFLLARAFCSCVR
jgi:hypothetical protein